MRGLTSTVALLVVLGGLAGYIYFVDSERPAGGPEAKDKVFSVEADKIQELRVTSGGETTVLRKADGAWTMVEPVKAEVDQTAVSSLTSNLATLEVNRVIDENVSDLAQYGLAEPSVRVTFTAENSSGEIAFGEKTATQGDLYAVKPGEKKVFLVPAFAETTFNKKPFDLRDKSALKFERDKVDRVAIEQGATRVELVKNGSDWRVQQPVQARADFSAVESLLSRLSSLSMTKLVEPDAKDLAQFGLDKPAITVSVGAGSSRALLAVGQEGEGGVFARDLSRPVVFTVDATLVADLKKGADEYRDKDLFEFRPFSAERLRLTRGAETFDFQKVKGTGENATDTWQRVNGASTAPVETSKLDDLLTKLSNLRAQSFSAVADASGQSQALSVAVSYDGGKFERVRIRKSEAGASAVREGEPSVAQLEVGAVDEAVTALDAALAPTSTPATAPTSPSPAGK